MLGGLRGMGGLREMEGSGKGLVMDGKNFFVKG
jgi:hypothetical protein